MIPGIVSSGVAGGSPPVPTLTYVGGKAVTVNETGVESFSLTDLTGGIASSPAAGDLVVATFAIGHGGSASFSPFVTTPNYRMMGRIYSDSSVDVTLGMFAKFMDATPDTAIDVAGRQLSTSGGALVIEVWRGVDPRYLLDVAIQTATGTATARPDPPSITPATAEAAIVVSGAGGAPSTGALAALTSSDLDQFKSASSSDVDNDCVVGLGHHFWTGGAFDAAQFGGAATGSGRTWASIVAALRPGSTALPAGPISFVGSATFNLTSGGGTVNFSDILDTSGSAADIQENDIVIVHVGYVGGTSAAQQAALTPDGYSPAHWRVYSNDDADTTMQVSYKFMGSTPDASVVVKAAASAQRLVGTIFVLRGVHLTHPLSVAFESATGDNTGIVNPPEITPAHAGSWIMCFGTSGSSSGTMADFTAPTGLSTTTNHFRSVINNSTFRAGAGAGLKNDWSSGAFDCPAFGGGVNVSTASWSSVALAIRPGPV